MNTNTKYGIDIIDCRNGKFIAQTIKDSNNGYVGYKKNFTRSSGSIIRTK